MEWYSWRIPSLPGTIRLEKQRKGDVKFVLFPF